MNEEKFYTMLGSGVVIAGIIFWIVFKFVAA